MALKQFLDLGSNQTNKAIIEKTRLAIQAVMQEANA